MCGSALARVTTERELGELGVELPLHRKRLLSQLIKFSSSGVPLTSLAREGEAADALAARAAPGSAKGTAGECAASGCQGAVIARL